MIEFIDLKNQQARIKDKIDAGIQRVLRHGQYILGPEVTELEDRLADFVGAKYCISCANGTDALQIVQMALGVGPGDEVITPGFTYVATAETVALLGAKPVYVDIDPRTYNLDPQLLELRSHRVRRLSFLFRCMASVQTSMQSTPLPPNMVSLSLRMLHRASVLRTRVSVLVI